MRLRLCIVGCGSYAMTVLNDIHDLTDELELYFASREIEKAKRYCDEFSGAGYFGSYREAFADPRIDAVYCFTPHHLHLENALAAARGSKHILMEKPIARTVEESTEMIDAARAAGVKLMVAENYRFLPTVEKCKQLLSQGSIGDLRLIQVQAEGFREPTEWRKSVESSGGGVLIDGGIHYVDILHHLGGFPQQVFAARPPQVHRSAEGEDGIVFTAVFAGGAVGLINFSAATVGEASQWVKVTGAKGQIGFAPYDSRLTIDTPPLRRTVNLPPARRGVRAMVREFRQAILDDRDPAMSGEEGLRDLEIVLAAYRSAEEGVSVSPGSR